MSNELVVALDFYLWLAVCIGFVLGLSILVVENARLRAKIKRLERLIQRKG